MTRIATLCSLLAVAAAGLAVPVPKALQRRPPVWMPLDVGCKWEYVSADDPTAVVDVREVTAGEQKDGDWYATQRTNNLTQVFRRDADGVAVVKSNNRDNAEPRYICRQKMKEGDSWESDLGGYTEVRTVGKAERIKMPAGEFLALPVHFKYVQNGTPFRTGTVWYADGVGLVRIDTDDEPTQVLKAFTPGKK